MSKVIEILNRIFDSRFIKGSTTIIDEPAEGMSRTLLMGNGISQEDILLCRLDQGDGIDMFPFLRGNSTSKGLKGMKRICDYAIFVDKDNVLYVLLIELKKGDESPLEQLNVTEPLIDFIFKRAKLLNHLDVNYEVRKIGITDKADKRRTSDRGNINYNEDRYVKLYSNKKFYLQRMLH